MAALDTISERDNMKKFSEEIKQELIAQDLLDTVLEIGWNYLQTHKKGDSK